MSTPQSTLDSSSSHINGLEVTINNKHIEDSATDTLKLAKEKVTDAIEELNSEIIHRSEDSSRKIKRNKFNPKKQSDDLQILVTVNKEHLEAVNKQLEIIDSIASPKYNKIFNKSTFNWIPSFVKKTWVKLIASILPPIAFGLLTALFINNSKKIDNWTIFGVLTASILSLVFGIWLLRFFSEAQKYSAQKEIKDQVKR